MPAHPHLKKNVRKKGEKLGAEEHAHEREKESSKEGHDPSSPRKVVWIGHIHRVKWTTLSSR